MRGFLIDLASGMGLSIAGAMPGLLTAAIIFLIARGAARLVRFYFAAVESGRITSRHIHPETAPPTRRLVIAMVWIFAVVLAYPYLPGSQTDAFKGVSVLLGVMVTVGSTGLVNQIMSGFMITYSRSLRIGDFVRIGSDEGTVEHLGILSVKIRNIWGEEITIPNAVVVTQTTTDYARGGAAGAVFTRTSVTIGYDTPWRQVHSLLLTAAERTNGLRRTPKPTVLQTSLADFYVEYTLLVNLERQELRAVTMDKLHANIQDLFNEYGVQIMSPHYWQDPSRPKVVAQQDWFTPPARADRASDS
jgi:small-conductance mechanosensitive channel